MNIPKRQHYIPKLLLKRFVDGEGHLYVCRRTDSEPKFWKSKPENAFVENDLYTCLEDDGNPDVSVEKDFANLEGAVSPIIDKIVTKVLEGQEPQLHADEKNIWRLFLIFQVKRTPDLRPYVNEKVDVLLKQVPDAFEKDIGRTLTTRERNRISDYIEHPDFRRRAKQNAFPTFAGGVKPMTSLLEKLQNTSISTGLIQNPNKDFVIGSRSITSYHEWFPVHNKVVVRLNARVNLDKLIAVKENTAIRRINEDIVRRSSVFAASITETN